MAGWLNSKLKAAEQFLQQIDQQAAESLKRSDPGTASPLISIEDNPSGPSEREYAKSRGSSFSEQIHSISKISTPKPFSNTGSISGAYNEQASLNKMSLNGKRTGTRNLTPQGPNNSGKMSKEDWTELLASPTIMGNSSTSRATSVGSSDVGVSRGVPIKSHLYSAKVQSNSASLAPTMVGRTAKQQSAPLTLVPVSRRVQPADKLSLNCDAVDKRLHGDPVGRDLNPDENIDQDENLQLQNLRLEDAESSTEEGQSSRTEKKYMKLAGGDTSYMGPQVDELKKTPLSKQEGEMKSLKDSNLDFLKTQHNAVETSKLNEFVTVSGEIDAVYHPNHLQSSLDYVSVSMEQQAASPTVETVHKLGRISSASQSGNLVQENVLERPLPESDGDLSRDQIMKNKLSFVAKDEVISEVRPLNDNIRNEQTGSRSEQNAISISAKEYLRDTQTEVDSDNDSEYEKNLQRLTAKKQKLVERKSAELAAMEAAKAAFREREELVKRLEKGRDSLQHALEEGEEKHAKEADDLRTSMMEVMDAIEMEKQRHTTTRKEALAKEVKLEAENAKLAGVLASAQRNLDKELVQLVEVRRKVDAQKVVTADLEKKVARLKSWIFQSQTPVQIEKAPEVESDDGCVAEKTEILSKIDHCKMKVKGLEEMIANAKNAQQTATVVELELEHRLNQLTEHLIQKQAQVEELSTEKVTLLFRLEALSNFQDEESVLDSPSTKHNKGGAYDCSRIANEMEYGRSKLYGSKYKNSVDVPNGLRGNMHSKALMNFPILEGFYRHINSLFLRGALILRMHKLARPLAGFYLLALHCWVFFILFMHSHPDRDSSIADGSSVLSIADTANALNSTIKSRVS